MKRIEKKPPILPVLKFNGNKDFGNELRRRVNSYFSENNKSRYAGIGLYLKGLLAVALYIVSYTFLVFTADEFWEGIAGAVFLGFALVGIGVNLQHDGSHNAFSKHRWINRLAALSLDFIGASSYFWRWKHTRFHHPYTNVFHFDTDIDFGILGRIAPGAKRYRFHRWQHLYMWVLYGLMVIKWHFVDDFVSLIVGRLGNHKIPRPTGIDLVVFIIGKVCFFFYAFILPVYFHPIGHVIAFYLVAAVVAGFTLSMVFVLPHSCEDAAFPEPDNESGGIESSREIHQVRVAVDFSRGNKLTTWLFGGLNFQREHHLFPGVCHVHYNHLAGIIDSVCNEFGVPHTEYRTYWEGLLSHYRWLQRMGRGERLTNQ